MVLSVPVLCVCELSGWVVHLHLCEETPGGHGTVFDVCWMLDAGTVELV